MDNYQKYKPKIRDNAKRRRDRNRAYAVSRMTPCENCGYFHPAAMDFHHENDDKFKDKNGGGVSRLIRGGYRLELLKEEIDKCVCLCSNCHRITHGAKT